MPLLERGFQGIEEGKSPLVFDQRFWEMVNHASNRLRDFVH